MPPLTVTELPMVSVRCTDGHTRYYGSDQVATFWGNDNHGYACLNTAPFSPLQILGVRHPGTPIDNYKPATEPDLKGFPKLLLERISIYKVSPTGLTFSRNVRFDTELLHWIIKAPGNYVAFYGNPDAPQISGLAIEQVNNRMKATYVSPTARGWSVTHLVPKGAWY